MAFSRRRTLQGLQLQGTQDSEGACTIIVASWSAQGCAARSAVSAAHFGLSLSKRKLPHVLLQECSVAKSTVFTLWKSRQTEELKRAMLVLILGLIPDNAEHDCH